MTKGIQLRGAAIYLLLLLIAVTVGFLLSQPDSQMTLGTLGVLAVGCCLPLLMKWHHALLIFACNATLNAFFLPGQPDIWMLTAFISLFFSIWKRTVSRETELLFVPSLSWPLIILAIVVVVTAKARGGVGFSALGSSNVGTKRYVSVIAAICAFFALSFQRIPKNRALLYTCLFFASGCMAAFSDLIYMAGPSFYFFYNFFPANLAYYQAAHDLSGGGTLLRLEGFAFASVAFSCFMLARYGVRELFSLRHPWRICAFLIAIVIGLFGGFRGRLFLIALFFVVQFCLEGLWRTRWAFILVGVGISLAAIVLPFTEKLPESFQRTLSFLPVEVDPNVRRDAEHSTTWRLEMWRVLLPEVPKYLWLGKGYAFSQSELYLTQLAEARGLSSGFESAVLTSEYHSGPLSVIVPFGLAGALAFIWFLVAGWRMLYRNFRYGDKALRKVNTFLLTYYSVKVFFFFVLYGSLYVDLLVFSSVLGLSLSINRGTKQKEQPQSAQIPPPVNVALSSSC